MIHLASITLADREAVNPGVRMASSCSCHWGETVFEVQSPTGLLFISQIYEYGALMELY
jgi:hypothetical protein